MIAGLTGSSLNRQSKRRPPSLTTLSSAPSLGYALSQCCAGPCRKLLAIKKTRVAQSRPATQSEMLHYTKPKRLPAAIPKIASGITTVIATVDIKMNARIPQSRFTASQLSVVASALSRLFESMSAAMIMSNRTITNTDKKTQEYRMVNQHTDVFLAMFISTERMNTFQTSGVCAYSSCTRPFSFNFRAIRPPSSMPH